MADNQPESSPDPGVYVLPKGTQAFVLDFSGILRSFEKMDPGKGRYFLSVIVVLADGGHFDVPV